MATLPTFNTDIKPLNHMMSTWASILNTLLRNPRSRSVFLDNVSLATGSNLVNHTLGRKLQGWSITRQRALASIYDTQDANPHPELTLSLVSSAPAVCDIEVW